VLEDLRDRRGADVACAQAMRVAPANPFVLHAEGRRLWTRRQERAALALLTQATHVDPTFDAAWDALAAIYQTRHQRTELEVLRERYQEARRVAPRF
jgi:Flp pilus assembly protein TadD